MSHRRKKLQQYIVTHREILGKPTNLTAAEKLGNSVVSRCFYVESSEKTTTAHVANPTFGQKHQHAALAILALFLRQCTSFTISMREYLVKCEMYFLFMVFFTRNVHSGDGSTASLLAMLP